MKPLNDYSDAVIFGAIKLVMVFSFFIGFGVGYLFCRVVG